MKRIKFDNLQNNWFFIFLIVVSLICIILGSFEIIAFENQKINKRISVFGYLAQFIFYSRIFVYKNYVQWNKKGIYIKVNQFFGTNLNFDDIKSINYRDNLILIKKHNNKEIVINLSNIQSSDTLNLFEIIQVNSI